MFNMRFVTTCGATPHVRDAKRNSKAHAHLLFPWKQTVVVGVYWKTMAALAAAAVPLSAEKTSDGSVEEKWRGRSGDEDAGEEQCELMMEALRRELDEIKVCVRGTSVRCEIIYYFSSILCRTS